MNIFESLENLPVSEECFDDIMGIVEELLNEDLHHYIQKKYNEKIENARKKEYAPKVGDTRSSKEIKKEQLTKLGLRKHELVDKAEKARANSIIQAYNDAQKRGLKRTEETDDEIEMRLAGFDASNKNEKGRLKNLDHNYEPGDYRSKKLSYDKFTEATKKSHPERRGFGKPEKEAIEASIERHNKKKSK